MEGTRQTIRNQILDWVTTIPGGDDAPRRNTCWFYGSPGIGKTSLAHSICANLHKRKHLAGSFFCRRDDPNLSESRNILPALINALAGALPEFRTIVANQLRNDPNLTSKSMTHSLFLDFICKLPHQPEHALVFVIDALDECGNRNSRPDILDALEDASTQASWLKIIITSRPEADIQRFFDSPTRSSNLRYDLAADEEAVGDLRAFAQRQFDLVASTWYLSAPWPEQSLFDKVIARANGLFIFIKTVVLDLEHCQDPTEYLRATVQASDGTGLNPLYGLYSSILTERIPPGNTEFLRVVGVLLTTAPYRSLCDDAIAALAGVRPNLVKKWVDDLSSLLYRDEAAKGGIRVRHLSISDFFFHPECHSEYQVSIQEANVELSIACVKTMVNHLHFNICKLEDSRLANADVKDLQSRIEQYIPHALQYSCLYWSNHLCFTPDVGDQRVWGSLKNFFERMYPLFWVEVLSIMEMVSIGAPSLRRVISWAKVSAALLAVVCVPNLLQDTDPTLLMRIQDICRFIITFHTPISISTPHTYISTQPFLPSQSPLSSAFSIGFTKAIKMQSGQMLSWPAPPLEWRGHTGTITCLSYSPDGQYIVSGSYDRTIRIWDVETGAGVGEPLRGHIGAVCSVGCSPDGQHITSGSDDSTIRIWDVGTGTAVGMPLKGHSGGVRFVAYSPNGRHIASGSDDGTIRIWDAKTGAVVGKPLRGHSSRVWSVAFSPDGQHIVSGSRDRTIRVWNANTGAAVGRPLEKHTGEVLSVAYSPDGQHIISGSSDSTIQLWDAGAGAAARKRFKGHAGVVWSVAYSPDGRRIISGSVDCTIRIWDAETGAAVGKPLEGHTSDVESVAFSPDGRHIISGSVDRSIRMWDAKTGDAVGNPLEDHSRGVWSVAYSPDGRHIISGSSHATIRIWDAKTGAAVGKPLEGHTSDVESVAFSPDGRQIISGSRDRTIRIWDARTGAAVGRPLSGHTDYVRSLVSSPNGQYIISGSNDNTVRIWDVNTGAVAVGPLMGHNLIVRSVARSPNGGRIASGSADRTIRVWDAKTGAVVGEPLTGHTGHVCSVTYSLDGQHIISGSADGTIRIWDANTGAAVGKPLEGHESMLWSVAYSPTRHHIISGSDDRTVRIWDAKTGAAVGKPLTGHSDNVRSVAYSPNGQYIVSGSADNTLRVWDALPHISTSVCSSCNPFHAQFCAPPDPNGWVRDSEGGLLYWVPLDYRGGLHSPALLAIPLTSHIRSVSLDFEDFVFGTSWTQIFNSAQC